MKAFKNFEGTTVSGNGKKKLRDTFTDQFVTAFGYFLIFSKIGMI